VQRSEKKSRFKPGKVRPTGFGRVTHTNLMAASAQVFGSECGKFSRMSFGGGEYNENAHDVKPTRSQSGMPSPMSSPQAKRSLGYARRPSESTGAWIDISTSCAALSPLAFCGAH
jgi:hypothetical protein